MQKNIYLSTVFVLLFAIEISGVHNFKCFRYVPWPISSCSRKCPKIFVKAHCEKYEGISQCICRTDAKDANQFTVDEANCVQRVSKREQNPKCATDLCPIGFRAQGHILEKDGDWQWYCDQPGISDHWFRKYALSKAKDISNACNDGTASEKKERCRHLCPDGYKYGDCVSDGAGSAPRCSCSPFYRLHDEYTIQEASVMASVCNEDVIKKKDDNSQGKGNQVKSNEGCAKLCPDGFVHGLCFHLNDNYMCGCRRELGIGHGWYTVFEARAMMKVCNSNAQGHNGCKSLCPTGYNYDGKCFHENGQSECQCKKDGESDFIPLRQANYEVDLKLGRIH